MKHTYLITILIILLSSIIARAGEPAHNPVISGPWKDLLDPKISGIYINDHTVYKDPMGSWHLVGITGIHPNYSKAEKWFAHGITSSLLSPMTEEPPLFKDFPDSDTKWAPHTIWEGDTLHLFAGPGKIRHLTSNDGHTFKYEGIAFEDRYKNLRDTMVIKLDDGTYIQYATDRAKRKDVISAWSSDDLYNWKKEGVVFTAIKPAPVWAPLPNSACESPFVIHKDGGYYLFVCLLNHSVYLNTIVLFSENPLDFGTYAAGGKGETSQYVTRLETHASEIIQDDDGKWWITTCGWVGFPRPKGCPGGKACIAPLTWEKKQ